MSQIKPLITLKNPALIRWLTVGSFFAFFVFGFTDNLKGPTIPALLRDLNFNYSQGGAILFGAYVGFLAATMFTGFLADIAGKKAVILLAGLSLTAGVGAYSYFSTFAALIAAMFALGLGMGAIEVGANAIIVSLHASQKARYLNLMSVFHGLGSTLAPLYAGRMLTGGISWRTVYRGDLVLVSLMILLFLLLRFPFGEVSQTEKIDLGALRRVAFTGQMGWFYFLIALYVAAEIGIASWIVEFLQTVKSQPIATSTQALSLFFATIMIGRLLGSFFIHRVDFLRIVLIASIAAIACVALGLFGPSGLAFLLPLTGLFLSIIFPTITAAVSDLHKENIGAVLGLLFTFAGVGGMLGPWLIGLLSDRFGITLGLALVLVFCALMIVSLIMLMKSAQTPLEDKRLAAR